MKKINLLALLIIVVSSIAAGSYWLGSQKNQDRGSRIEDNGETVNGKLETGNRKPETNNRKLLYYRNPMGLADTSPVPKKDAMGMDYVAVYEGDAGTVSISPDRVQKLGVRSEAAQLRVLHKTLRVAARIEVDERHIHSISPKFEGWVERLYVNSTGQIVAKGQPLFDVYSPELVSVQREYALARQGQAALTDSEAKEGMKQLADAGLERLKNWDVGGKPMPNNGRRSLTFSSPVSGVVLDKKALQGMRFMPGESLYQIADLSSVWVVADVPEQEIGRVLVGNTAQVSIAAYPEQNFSGKITFIYPVLNTATRTVQVRMELANPKGLFKPGMFANLALAKAEGSPVLTVPASSVIDSGTRQVVLVRLAEGRFEPRSVKLGSRSDDYVEVLDGIARDEQVVTSANFLIDAESNLKAALGSMSAAVSPTDAGRDLFRQASPEPVEVVGLKPDLPNKAAGHRGQGILNAINADGTVNITFETMKTLAMQGMTMDFQLANASLAAGIKPGSAVSFELVQRKPDEWLITRLQARPVKAHEGH